MRKSHWTFEGKALQRKWEQLLQNVVSGRKVKRLLQLSGRCEMCKVFERHMPAVTDLGKTTVVNKATMSS